MKEETLQYFVCPSCHTDLRLDQVEERKLEHVKEGSLICGTGKHRFKITGFVPRFVPTDNYTSSFGFEWNQHGRTQLDSVIKTRQSEERFFRETKWARDLSGETILEVGSGAGRFTEIALQTGALVISADFSLAVDVNWGNNGHHPNLILCQASMYELPFRPGTLDKVFCFGVLQHTPDVHDAFASLTKFPRPGGELVVDAYNKDYWRNYHTPIYFIRHLTKHIPHDRLYRWVSWMVPRLLPVSTWLRCVPLIGRQLSALVPISNVQGMLQTSSEELIVESSILDTFDTLSPMYISPQRPSVVRRWFAAAGYEQIEFDREVMFFMRGKRPAT